MIEAGRVSDGNPHDVRAAARLIREDIVHITSWAGGAHIGGALSATDILAALYFGVLRIDPDRPDWEDRDRFVLSKGHAAVAYVAALARRGYFPVEELKTFNKFKSPFGMHPDSRKVRGCDVSTGSLGHGLPMAVGMALGARLAGRDLRVYCILGDGECGEGSVWEALMAGAHYRLGNLVAVIDRNGLMIDGPTETVMSLEPLAGKLETFGWEVVEVDGHDIDSLTTVLDVPRRPVGKPRVVIARTVKGKGVDFMEGQVSWHYGSVDDELRDRALRSIGLLYGDSERGGRA